MKKTAFAIAISALFLGGCGARVEVPPAHVGKIMTKDGYREGIIDTSKFRLDFCTVYCDKLVTLDVSDHAFAEQMELFMPRDKLMMHFDVKLTLAVNPEKYEQIYALIPPTGIDTGNTAGIQWERVYNTYARNVVIARTREILSQYTIADVASSREAINQEISTELSKTINQQTPFILRYIGIADVGYPPIIIKAQENAAERREMINQENAQLEISKVQLERKLQEEKMKRAIEVEKAEADAQVNNILAQSVSDEYVQYRRLQVLEQMATSDNKVFVPVEMLDTVAAQVMMAQ